MKWTETITPKQAAEELGVPYHGWMREMDRAWISEDQKYSVMSRLLRTEWGKVEHVTITAAEGVGRIRQRGNKGMAVGTLAGGGHRAHTAQGGKVLLGAVPCPQDGVQFGSGGVGAFGQQLSVALDDGERRF